MSTDPRERSTESFDLPARDEGERKERSTPSGRLGLLAIPLVLLMWVVVGALSYVSMFTCSGPFYESGCDYAGPGAGVGFALVMTVIGALSIRGIAALGGGHAMWGLREWSSAASVALVIGLVVLLGGSPWTGG